jgi:PAS domain S-box-containing protein
MRWLTDLPIRIKLIIIIVLTCMTSLLLAGTSMVVYDYYDYKSQLETSLSTQAEILSSGVVASLEFEDAAAAQEYLKPLAASQTITAGAVYKANGKLFVSYTRPGSEPPPAFAIVQGQREIKDTLIISSPVMQGERMVGSVYLRTYIEPLLTRMARYVGLFLLAMLVSLLFTLPIALRLHYLIANPTYARSLIEASLDPFITINPQGEITDVNQATINATGLSRERLIGTDFSNYFTDPAMARESYQQVFSEGSLTDYPLTIRHVDGRLIDVLYNASVYKDEKGRVLGVFAAARDVTAQKLAEQEINRRTAELQVANQELEAFSYSVSHDLRAPLRAIDGFSLALMEDCADRLDETGKDYLNRVRAATQRMGHLIDDMLELSRIARMEMRHEAVDLSGLAVEVLEELQKGDRQRKVAWQVEPGMTVMGDARLLRVVLTNLLGNAWKYTGRQPEPRIEFGSRTNASGAIEYFIRDNGAGFDMAYASKLFGPFQRLHTMSEFPGTGVGLAIVQRIIHRHGGEVHGEGVPDQGAIFYFSLPERIKEGAVP